MKPKLFFKRNSSTILTVLGCAGVTWLVDDIIDCLSRKDKAIRKYIKEMLPDIDEYSDVVYYPGKEHYTEFKILIEDLKSDNPPVVTTQNKEFIEYLLESDLDFNVTTAYLDEDDKKLAHRNVTKETAKEMVYSMGLELR